MKNNKLWDGVKTLLNDYSVSLPALDVPILPERPVFGEIADDEIVIIRSEQDIIRSVGEAPNPVIFDEIEEIIKTSQERGSAIRGRETLKPRPEWGEPCAWYCPLHYFGPDWGIYIREDCVIDVMFDVAHYINWSAVPPMNLYQLRNFAFYYFYFHNNC